LSNSLKNNIITLLGIFIALTTNGQGISGILQNEKGNPIEGASITILNTSLQTISNQKGFFEFKELRTGKYTISIKSIGYAESSKAFIVNQSSASNTIIKLTLIASTNQLDEVVVTAEKKEELLQKIPASITAINAKQINAFGLWNTKEITGIIPNLYSADPGDNRDLTSVRGIATSSYDPTVATYIDGVNQFSLDTYIPSLFDIERIEVLRGPQGTLYGRNAMGGVINIITKQPNNTSSGFADISLGNYNQQRITAGFKTPLIKDKLFFGASVLSNKRDGYYTNEFTQTSYDQQNGLSGNYFLKYIANDRWNFNFNFKQLTNENQGPFPLVFGTEDALNNPYRLNQNSTTTMKDKTSNSSLSIRYTGSDFNFSSQTAYQQNYRYYTNPIDGDFSPIDAISVINNYGSKWNNNKVLTQDLKFTSNNANNSKFKWTAGAFLFYQDAPVKQATRFGIDANLMMIGDSLFSIINTSTTLKKGFAIYGQATYALSDKLNMSFGLRNDYENQTLSILGEYQRDPSPELYTTTPDTLGRTNFNAFSPKLSLDYQVNNYSLWYGSYSKGFRAGGLSPLSSDPSQPPLLGYLPEYSNNFETGIKNNWLNNKLILNIALFYTKVTDAQVPSLILPDAITITKNTGQLSSKGVEAELMFIPTKGLLLQYSFGTTSASYDKLEIASQGASVNLAGKRPIFTPSSTSLLAAQYSFPVSSEVQIMLRGEWKYIGTTYFDLANNIEQSPYYLLNAKLGMEYKRTALSFWAKNLAGTKYISYGYDFGAVHLGDPAIFGTSFSFKF